MSKISCTVSSCVYNKFHSCLRDKIFIEGEQAKLAKETECYSFKERRIEDLKSEFSNLDYPLWMKVDVKCEVNNCCFNELKRCNKDKIDIDHNFYLGKVKTKCSSFEEKIR